MAPANSNTYPAPDDIHSHLAPASQSFDPQHGVNAARAPTATPYPPLMPADASYEHAAGPHALSQERLLSSAVTDFAYDDGDSQYNPGLSNPRKRPRYAVMEVPKRRATIAVNPTLALTSPNISPVV